MFHSHLCKKIDGYMGHIIKKVLSNKENIENHLGRELAPIVSLLNSGNSSQNATEN